MDDVLITYERICRVLKIFLEDTAFFPKFQDMEELNPTGSPMKRKIHKIESAWDWRNRVLSALRTQDELYGWEILWRKRYLTNQERFAFYKFYFDGAWHPEMKKAVKKIDRLFERARVYWE